MVKQRTGGAQQVMGITGLSIWAGVLGEDYLQALRGRNKVNVFKEMQDDAIIACLLDAVSMPLVAAEFSTVPASDSEKDKANADFLWECMNDMTRYSWRQHVLDMLTMLVWGWSASEMVFKRRDGEKGERRSAFDDGKIGLHILDPRGQETLYRWRMDPEEFEVEAMEQQDPNDGRLRTVEGWKLLHATFRSRKRSPEGTSPLRSLYRYWYTRKNLEIIEAIGAERDLCGLPVVYLPYGASADDKKAAELIVRNVRQDEEAGLVIPAPPTPEAGKEAGWKIELLASGGAKQFNVREIVRDLNKIIMMRFFAQFLLLGMDKVGTQALVQGSQDFFSLALKSVQQELLEVWNGQLVPLLFSLNPGMMAGTAGLPTIDWADPGSQDTQKIVTMAKDMISAQILTPEQELEDYFRMITGLPDRPEGIGEEPREKQPGLQPGLPPELAGLLGPGEKVPGEIPPQLMSYEWYQMPDGAWLVRPKATPKKRFALEVGNPPVLWHVSGFDVVNIVCPKCSSEEVDPRPEPFRWSCLQCGTVWDVHYDFTEVAGIQGRRLGSRMGAATNHYQAVLTRLYDQWTRRAQKAMVNADAAGEVDIGTVLDKQLVALGVSLRAAAGQYITEAFKIGLKGKPVKGAASVALEILVERNNKFMDESLIPRIRTKVRAHLTEIKELHQYAINGPGLLGLLQSLRSEPAGYAGAFWNGIFVAAGIGQKEEDNQRKDSGERPRRVRWVLDPAAEHCADSAHGRGCPGLEGEYASWEELPEVPAGGVTCLGNCRCHIEVESDDGGWEAVA